MHLFADTPVAAVPVFTLSAFVVSLVVGTLIPILTGIVTKASLSSGVKGLITLVLSMVSAAVTAAVVSDGSAVFSRDTLLLFFITFVQGIAAYYGVLKPLGVTSTPNSEGKAGLAPGTGIG
jgi:putative effector of murein hydrolase LrgA (UPF0299 family)